MGITYLIADEARIGFLSIIIRLHGFLRIVLEMGSSNMDAALCLGVKGSLARKGALNGWLLLLVHDVYMIF